MAGLSWRGLRLSKGGSIPKGFEPQDMAQRAVLAVLQGKRACSAAQMASFDAFLEFLKGVVDSFISHLVTGAENRRSRRMSETNEDQPAPQDVLLEDPFPPPDKVVEDREYLQRFRDELVKELAGDARAMDILTCIEAGYVKKQEMAELLGCPVKELYDAQKRYQRKVEKVRSKLSGERP
jgi:hypothetical protein